MERMGLVYRVKPEKKEEYIYAHDNIWPELAQEMRQAGVKRMYIYERDNLLFLFAEIENLEEYGKWQAASAVYGRWSAWMDRLLETPYDPKEPGVTFASMQEVFAFE